MRRPWTQHELATLRQHHGKLPMSAIARMIGKSHNAVRCKVRFEGMAFNNKAETGPEFEKFLRHRHRLGWSDYEIAAAWFCDRATVRRWRRKLGLASNRFNARHLAKMAKARREQFRRAGVKNFSELRWLAKRIAEARAA